jgi:hypothetical protein
MIFGTGLAQDNKLTIAVDERVELMTTIQLICNSSVATLSNADISYMKEVTERFGKYVNHPAVVTFDSIYFKYFNFEMPFEFILHYSLPDFDIIAPIEAGEFSGERHYDHHVDSLALFMKQLKAFYVEADFHDFFVAHRSLYDSLRNDVTSTLENKNIIPVLEKYYGKSYDSYDLVLSPLSLDGGFGITVRNTNASHVFAIIGPAYTSKGYPDFKKSKTVVIHELSHPFSNPVIDSCWSSIREDTCLYRPVLKDMQKEGYWGWMAVVYETFNRANEVLLTSQVVGEAEAKGLFDNYISKKYIYLPLCIEVLEQYKANRTQYKSITDITPVLIEAFEAEKHIVCHENNQF